jgi:AcrR family transcriptional regulator
MDALKTVDMPAKTSRKPSAKRSASEQNGKRAVLDRAAWLAKARDVLIEGGIGSVKVGKLAGMLSVTRESFYHHFKSLEELHDELLAEWEHGNEAAYKALLDVQRDGEQEFRAMEKMWLAEARYSPAWDSAIRDWARISKKADQVVRHVDERRVEMIRRMYLDMGFEETEALVRARIYYFHQVGYYTIKPGESREERMRLFPVYIRVLMGRS